MRNLDSIEWFNLSQKEDNLKWNVVYSRHITHRFLPVVTPLTENSILLVGGETEDYDFLDVVVFDTDDFNSERLEFKTTLRALTWGKAYCCDQSGDGVAMMLVTSEKIGGLHVGRYTRATRKFEILSTFDDQIIFKKL